MTRILVVEDEESYREPLAYQLTKEGFDVVVADTGTQALAEFDRQPIDLVLLDVMLPEMSGVDVCRQLRTVSAVPIIMLTAKDGEIDKVVGLELGADDYVTKPYSFRELLARIRAVLRRIDTSEEEPDEERLSVGRITMDVQRHEVHIDGEQITMPLREFELLELFLRNPDRVLTRGLLIERIWGADYVGDTKTLDVHVKRVRAKIEPDPSEPQTLQTVRGVGYKLVSD